MWLSEINGFKIYLQLERSLSAKTIEAYLHDIGLLATFFGQEKHPVSLKDITLQELKTFLHQIAELGLSNATQARITSGIKAFFRYLTLEQDRKSTRLNSSHVAISYAVFCLKKKNHNSQLTK